MNYKIYHKPQIFLLHFAGGSCYSFNFLRKYVSPVFEFIPLELPGRGKRYNESPILCKEDSIKDYTTQIIKERNGSPYVVYGHSMGATLGLSVAKKLEDMGDPPSYLVVSGNAGPKITEINSQEKRPKRYLMEEVDFKEELRKLGGVPEEVLKNEDLYNFFSPVMRADFEVLEKESDVKIDFVLQVPIFALMGSREKNSENIENWGRFTSDHFRFKVLEGDHFFINEHPAELIGTIEKCLLNSSVEN